MPDGDGCHHVAEFLAEAGLLQVVREVGQEIQKTQPRLTCQLGALIDPARDDELRKIRSPVALLDPRRLLSAPTEEQMVGQPERCLTTSKPLGVSGPTMADPPSAELSASAA